MRIEPSSSADCRCTTTSTAAATDERVSKVCKAEACLPGGMQGTRRKKEEKKEENKNRRTTDRQTEHDFGENRGQALSAPNRRKILRTENVDRLHSSSSSSSGFDLLAWKWCWSKGVDFVVRFGKLFFYLTHETPGEIRLDAIWQKISRRTKPEKNRI